MNWETMQGVPARKRVLFDKKLNEMLEYDLVCLTCGRYIEPDDELPLVAQWSCGVALNNRVIRDFDRQHDYFDAYKVLDDPEAWLSIWGPEPMWNAAILRKAVRLIEEGIRPWYCYHCGGHYCAECVTPYDIPYQADFLDWKGIVDHTAHLKLRRNRCHNEGCRLYVEPGEETVRHSPKWLYGWS
jgi:hypothetical protein